MGLKSEKFDKFLEKNEIKAFEVEKIEDDLKSVVYRSKMEVEGQNLPMVIINDESIYTVIRVGIVTNVLKDKDNTNLILKLNELNRQFKVFKYYVTESGDLILESTIVADPEEFNADMIYVILNVILEHLTVEYKSLMKLVWE